MEVAVERIEREGSLTHRTTLAIDPAEADCAVQALTQCDMSKFALVIGCERVAAIARRAGLPLYTPVVRSVVDPAFVLFTTGSDDQEAVANWHCHVAKVLREHQLRTPSDLFRISTAWTVGELLAAREAARELRRRKTDIMADLRKRRK